MADQPAPFVNPSPDPSTLGPYNPPPVATQPSTLSATIAPQQAPVAPSFAPPQGQQSAQAAPQPPNRHEVLGRTLGALMGQNVSYGVDANGNTVETSTPQKPGQLFRSILASALLGGAAGANGPSAQGFAGGVARGGAAGVQENQQQDLLKRQQAQVQFQNQQRAAQQQREADSAVTEDTLRKAQIAHANAETVRTNQVIQGESYDLHNKVADKGKQHFSDYDAAGLNPVVKDIPESGMADMLKNRPGASTLDWEPTGTKVTVGSDGQPSYENTYTAYDPKGQIPVSKGTIDQWKADGMDKYYPELFDILKPGKQLDATQYIELKRKDSQMFNDQQTRNKADFDTEVGQAKLRNINAETAAHLAQGAHTRAETGQIGESKKASQALSTAYADLDAAGGDLTKVKPSTRVTIGESYSKMLPALSAEIKSAQAEGDDEKVKSLMSELDGMRHLATQAMQGGAAPNHPAAGQGTIMLNPSGQQVMVTADKMDAAVKAGYKPAGGPPAPKQPSISDLTPNMIPNASAR